MTKTTKYIIAVLFCLAFFAQRSDAQFKEGAFTQNYNEPGDTTGRKDTVEKLFSFKEFFGEIINSKRRKRKIDMFTFGEGQKLIKKRLNVRIIACRKRRQRKKDG